MDGYFGALGRFVHAYAQAEALFFQFARLIARLDFRIVQALMGDFSLVKILDAIEKIYLAHNEQPPATLKNSLQHFRKIAKFRNAVVHLSAFPNATGEGGFIVSNEARKLQEKSTSTSIEISTFDDLIADIQTVSATLHLLLFEGILSATRPPQDDINELKKMAERPWRYNEDIRQDTK